jgi:hypothetical protein
MPERRTWDGLVLGGLLLVLLVGTATTLVVSQSWRPDAVGRPPWCLVGQVPSFQFGFAELAGALDGTMGEPLECEHGDEWTGDTRQLTTTGVAIYRWCTNTPTFSRADEHWMLTVDGLQHWIGGAGPPLPPPVMRLPDLRQPCLG